MESCHRVIGFGGRRVRGKLGGRLGLFGSGRKADPSPARKGRERARDDSDGIQEQELGCHRYSGDDPAILKRLRRGRRGGVFGSEGMGGILKRFWRWVVGGRGGE